MITVDEHTFDETLLTPESHVLDVGCRGFGFARAVAALDVERVVAVDADPAIAPPDDLSKRVRFIHAALARDDRSAIDYYGFGDGTASYTEECGPRPAECRVTRVRTFRVDRSGPPQGWDLVKLDCEGAEYDALLTLERPYPRQITVEFHEHTQAARGTAFMRRLLERMDRRGYAIHIGRTPEWHRCSENFGDVLFRLRAP